MKQIFFIFTFLTALLLRAHCQGPTQSTALVNLQRANVVEGSRAGQFGLTDANGRQRYAQYVEVDLVPITYTPPATGNTQNYSEFVTTTGGDIYYIDWQGRSIKLWDATAGGGSTNDYDWLEIGNNQIPNSIADSIYTSKYAAINMRRVWPNTQLLVGDSTGTNGASGIVAGDRSARWGFVRMLDGSWSSIGQEGTNNTVRLGPGTVAMKIQVAAGASPSEAIAPFRDIASFRVDSLIRFNDYPNTRDDSEVPVNFLYTDGQGYLKSGPVSDVSGGSSGNVCLDTISITGISPTPIVGTPLARITSNWDNVSGLNQSVIPTAVVVSVSGSTAVIAYCGTHLTTLSQGGYYADSISISGFAPASTGMAVIRPAFMVDYLGYLTPTLNLGFPVAGGLSSVSVTARLSGNGSGIPLDIAQQGATTGQALTWNGTTWVPGTVASVTNLDDAYNNFGANPAKITIDNAQGQGSLVFEPINHNIEINLAGLGDFIVKDNGTTVGGFYDSGFFGQGIIPTSLFHQKSSGTSSAVSQLLLQNSANTNIFDVRQSGDIWLPGNTLSATILASDGRIRTNKIEPKGGATGGAMGIAGSSGTGAFGGGVALGLMSNATHTTGHLSVIYGGSGYLPTSGNGTFTQFEVFGPIDQTGGANGITRGIHGNVSPSRAADYRGLEIAEGAVLFLGNSFTRLQNVTTAVRDTFNNASHGSGALIYNSTTNTFQGRDHVSYKNFLSSANTVQSLLQEQRFTATSGQTNFTIAVTQQSPVGNSMPVHVFRNGIRLDYIASGPNSTQFTYSATTITTSANVAGDRITVEYLN